MDLSYQEKSIAGSLIAMLVVYGYYFAGVLRNMGQSEFAAHSLGRLILAVIAIIVIQIAYQIALALETNPEPKDERDILIESKAYRNAYFVLGVGAFCTIYVIAAGLASNAAATSSIGTPFLVMNRLLLFLVLADVVKLVTQLFYYRKGF